MIQDKVINYLRRCNVRSGLMNCHLPGLISLVLEERESSLLGMLRLFLCTEDNMHTLIDKGRFMLAPHDHRQAIALYTLTGSPANAVCDFRRKDLAAFKYKFTSGLLNDDFKTELIGQVDFGWSITPIPSDGSGIHLPNTVFHTVVARPGDCWIVREGAFAGPDTHCLGLSDNLKFSKEGLYLPMTEMQIFGTVMNILSRFKEENPGYVEALKAKEKKNVV